MKEIKRTSSITVEIDGDVYVKSAILEQKEPKPKWPTNMNEVNDSVQNWQTVDINDLDSDKFAKMSDCLDAARLINGDWKPDWEDGEVKYCPILSEHDILDYMEMYQARNQSDRYRSFVWFPTVAAYEHFKKHFRSIWFEAIG